MRPVSTMSCVESCATASFNATWMVTGTTASSGDHNNITGITILPVARWQSRARYSVCPGSVKPAR